MRTDKYTAREDMHNKKTCPKCSIDLSDGDVYDVLRTRHPEKSGEVLLEWAKQFGWSPSNRIQFKREIALIHNDKVIAYKCPECLHEWSDQQNVIMSEV